MKKTILVGFLLFLFIACGSNKTDSDVSFDLTCQGFLANGDIASFSKTCYQLSDVENIIVCNGLDPDLNLIVYEEYQCKKYKRY